MKKISSTKVSFLTCKFGLQKKIHLFSLERKIQQNSVREMIYMFRNECINNKFYKHICKSKNLIYLNSKNILHPKTSEIVMEYIEEDVKNYEKIKKNFIENKNIFQYVYAKCYPDVYSSSEGRGIKLTSGFCSNLETGKMRKKEKLPKKIQ